MQFKRMSPAKPLPVIEWPPPSGDEVVDCEWRLCHPCFFCFFFSCLPVHLLSIDGVRSIIAPWKSGSGGGVVARQAAVGVLLVPWLFIRKHFCLCSRRRRRSVSLGQMLKVITTNLPPCSGSRSAGQSVPVPLISSWRWPDEEEVGEV